LLLNLPHIVWKTFPLVWVTWGEESIVFNKSSGNTHLVNSMAAKILSLLQVQARSAEEICQSIATEMQLDADDEILQRVKVVFETLDHLGLIESLPQ
jgi:PqqD family protein of HPr-rel-A system